ncbi:putative ngg1 interacting factor [Phaeomoniella chlamydospora]|uniref:Putative ngg1 interacting factor n=1 Tax=Phaeomoniella chlamydospora TaxID=158046 RepID=A0A0G2EXV4_PHACM|nr:putative ngg1 interacting factor [Phaeomoniella chlamydospora]
MNSVLLTVDLTKAVAEEAIEGNHCVVIAYHPIIFRGFKSLTLADPQQQSLLRLALEGISVYSPHTAVDAASDGMTDWLCDIVTGTLPDPEPETHTAEIPSTDEQRGASESTPSSNGRPPMLGRSYSKPTYPTRPSSSSPSLRPATSGHTRSVIHPSQATASLSDDRFTPENTGAGRLVTFNEPQPLTHLIERIARGVGTPKGFPVAIPQNQQVEDMEVKTVGICPGSGGSVLRSCNADLLFTGELSHHEALAATERGAAVVTLFHSNSERGYLHSVMKGKLKRTLETEWKKTREEMLTNGETGNGEWDEALADETVDVIVSERDRDPYGIVILQDMYEDVNAISQLQPH